MKATFNQAILARITREIDFGDPIWGILWINEYLEPEDTLRLTLIRRAKEKIKEDPIVLLILGGATLEQLNQEQLAKIFNDKAKTTTPVQKRVIPNMRRTYRERARLFA